MTPWVPETELIACDLLLRLLPETGMITPVGLRLTYVIFSKLLAWMVLRARSDTRKEIEILIRACGCREPCHGV